MRDKNRDGKLGFFGFEATHTAEDELSTMSQYSRQVVYGILSVVSTLLPPLNRLLQLLRAGC